MALDARLRNIVTKSAGVYFLVTDNSQVQEITAESKLRIFFINEEKGPVNSLVQFAQNDISGFESIYGKSLRTVEKKGNFGIKVCEDALSAGPIGVVNLRKFDDTIDKCDIAKIAVNVTSTTSKGVDKQPYKSLFNMNGFWSPKSSYITDKYYPTNYLNIANIGINNCTVFVTKATDSEVLSVTNQGDYTLESTSIDIEEYPALDWDMLFKDLFVTVWVFNNDFSVVNGNYSQYFDANNCIKQGDLESLSAISSAGFVSKYTGCIIPSIKNENDFDISIDTVLYTDFVKTGIICDLNSDLLEINYDPSATTPQILFQPFGDISGYSTGTTTTTTKIKGDWGSTSLSLSGTPSSLSYNLTGTFGDTNITATYDPTSTGSLIVNIPLTLTFKGSVNTQGNITTTYLGQTITLGVSTATESEVTTYTISGTLNGKTLSLIGTTSSWNTKTYDNTTLTTDPLISLTGSNITLIISLSGTENQATLTGTSNLTGTYYGDKTATLSNTINGTLTTLYSYEDTDYTTNETAIEAYNPSQPIDDDFDFVVYHVNDDTRNTGTIIVSTFNSNLKTNDYIIANDNTLARIISIENTGETVISGASTTPVVILTLDKPYKKFGDDEDKFVKYHPITNNVKTVVKSSLYLNSYVPRTSQFLDGTSSKQEEILNVITEPWVVKGLSQVTGVRYLIDTFKSYVENNYKHQYGELINLMDNNHKYLTAIINEPFINDLEKSVDPLFKDSPSDSLLNYTYLPVGGNPQYTSKKMYKFTTGVGNCFFFGPEDIIKNISKPSSGLISNLFYNKTNQWDIVANSTGYISGITELGDNFTDDDRIYLERFRYNPIIDFDGGFTIYGNLSGTAVVSKQQQIHNVELLCYIKDSLYNMAKSDTFKKGDYNEYLRIETETQNFMDTLALAGAIKADPVVICNSTNNTEEISNYKIKLVRVEYTPYNCDEKVVFDLNIY